MEHEVLFVEANDVVKFEGAAYQHEEASYHGKSLLDYQPSTRIPSVMN